MNITQAVSQQVFIMLCLILVGAALFKAKILTEKGTKDMSGILLTIVTPCVLIQAYQIDADMSAIKSIGKAFLFSIVLHICFIVISYLVSFFRKDKNLRKIEIFTSVYSNCGFMGIPLLSAALGEKGVLFGSAYLAVFNVLAWTHGLLLYGEDMKLLSIKNLVKNPGIIGTLLALLLFFLKIKLSGFLSASVGYIADLNTPLAMILLGAYLARCNFISAFKQSSLYAVAAMRLMLLPTIGIFVLKLMHAEPIIAASLALSAACPCATIAALFAEKFDIDTGLPSQIVSVTTILSVATLPAVAWLSSAIIG